MMTKRPRLVDPAELPIDRIDDDPRYKAALGELQALEKRLAETQQRRERAQARLRGVRPTRGALERAGDLVKGGRIPAATPIGEIEACDQEEWEVLRPAIATLSNRLAELRADLSYDVCVKVRPVYDDALRELMHGIETIAVSLRVIHGIRASLALAGHQPNSSVLLDALPPAIAVLGDPRQVGVTQSWIFAEKLRERRVI